MSLTIDEAGTIDEHWPPALPVNQDRTEVRILSIVMTGFFMAHLFEPAMYAATVDDSILSKVVGLTHQKEFILSWFFGCVAAMVPHFVILIFMPGLLHCKLPRQIACAGAVAASILWFYLANLARPLDAGALPYIYAGRALFDAMVAGVLAFSLNAQQLRPYFDDAPQTG